MSARDDLAKVFAEHQYALGYDGILSDGQWAWLKCTCGYKENVELPTDDIRIAEAAWERHLADAILSAGWVPPERLADVVSERDKAREECGYEKRMRASAQEASDRYIRLKMDRDKTLQRVHDLLDRKPMVPAADLRTALGGQEGTSSC